MTLKDKLEVEIMDLTIMEETIDAIGKNLEYVANDFAIEFAEWTNKYDFLPNSGWFSGSYQLEMGIFKSTKELL